MPPETAWTVTGIGRFTLLSAFNVALSGLNVISTAPWSPISSFTATDALDAGLPLRGFGSAQNAGELAEQSSGYRVEEARAGDDALDGAVVDDGDDEYAVVEERLGDLEV